MGSAPPEFHRATLDTLALLSRRHPQKAERYALSLFQRALRRGSDAPLHSLSEIDLDADVAALRAIYVTGDGSSAAIAHTLEPALPGLLQLLAAAQRCKSRLADPAKELVAAYFSACGTAEGGKALARVLLQEWTLSASVPPTVFGPGGSGGLVVSESREGEEATEAAANPTARFDAVASLLEILARLSRPALLTSLISHLIERSETGADDGTCGQVLQVFDKGASMYFKSSYF